MRIIIQRQSHLATRPAPPRLACLLNRNRVRHKAWRPRQAGGGTVACSPAALQLLAALHSPSPEACYSGVPPPRPPWTAQGRSLASGAAERRGAAWLRRRARAPPPFPTPPSKSKAAATASLAGWPIRYRHFKFPAQKGKTRSVTPKLSFALRRCAHQPASPAGDALPCPCHARLYCGDGPTLQGPPFRSTTKPEKGHQTHASIWGADILAMQREVGPLRAACFLPASLVKSPAL